MEGELLLKFDSSVRSFAYNRHVGGSDCFAFELCNLRYANREVCA